MSELVDISYPDRQTAEVVRVLAPRPEHGAAYEWGGRFGDRQPHSADRSAQAQAVARRVRPP
ncbi:MAG: hypothetical protein QOG77_244 [Solirubrobacteraceae bacterium]|nr:hypothetical protein [Solirubrobacteraceae bacterium]